MRNLLWMMVLGGLILANPVNARAEVQWIVPTDNGVSFLSDFGKNVAVSGDWAAASSIITSDSADRGAVHLMHRNNGLWQVGQKLVPTIQGGFYSFGRAVAISGEWLAVGAIRPSGSPRTAVFVYRLVSGSWALQDILNAGGFSNGEMGLAISGERIVIGRPGTTVNQPVFCYRRNGVLWSLEQEISPPGGTLPYTGFGASLDIEGNVLAVGGPADQGRVYEFRHNGTSWQQTRMIQAPTQRPNDQFGRAVKLAGGRAVVLSRSIYDSVRKSEVHVYGAESTGWTLLRTFGGDGSLDCFNADHLDLSATKLIMRGSQDNRLVEFQLNGPGAMSWIGRTLTVPNLPAQGGWGLSIGLDGDSGFVGMRTFTEAGRSKLGRFLPLSGSPGSVIGTPVVPEAVRRLGTAVTLDGDVAAVGNSNYVDNEGYTRGCVHVIERQAGRWALAKLISLPEQAEAGHIAFGEQVVLKGRWLAVAAPQRSLPPTIRGNVYLYERGAEGWPSQPTVTVQAPLSPTEAIFGQHLSFSGEYLAVLELGNTGLSGAVRVYRIQDRTAVQIGLIKQEDPLGVSLTAGDMRGDLLAITDQSGRTRAPGTQSVGEIRLYRLSATGISLVTTLRSAFEKQRTVGFAYTVRLGDGVLTTGVFNNGGLWCETFGLKNGVWKAFPEMLPLMAAGGPRSIHSMDVDERQMLMTTEDEALLYTLGTSGWVMARRDVVPQSAGRSLDAAAISGDTILALGGQNDGAGFFQSGEVNAGLVIHPTEPNSANGMELYAGQLKVGQNRQVEVYFQNRGGRPLRFTEFTTHGVTDPDGLVSASFVPQTLAPLQSMKVTLTVNPPAEGSYGLELRPVCDDPSLGDLVFLLMYDGMLEPSLAEGDESEETPYLVELGRGLVLEGHYPAAAETKFEWFKDGARVPKQDGPFLVLPSVKATDAGRYRVAMRTPGHPGSSRRYVVGIYQQQVVEKRVKGDSAVSFKTQVWGPGVKVRWPFTESWVISGTHTPELKISRAALMPSYPVSTFWSTVSLGGQQALATVATLRLLNPPFINIDGPRVVPRNAQLNISVSDGAYDGVQPLVLSISGLPPGLQVSQSGGDASISGIPTKTGSYRIMVQSRNEDGTGAPVYHDLIVHDENRDAPGYYGPGTIFAGQLSLPPWLAPDPEARGWGAQILVSTTKGGGFSGTLQMREGTRRFAGRVVSPEEDPFTRIGVIRLGSLRGYSQVSLELIEMYDGHNPVPELRCTLYREYQMLPVGGVECALSPVVHPSIHNVVPYQGMHSMLITDPESADIFTSPQGSGFASMNVSKSLMATGAGTFSHGVGFTFSAPIVLSPGESTPRLPWMAVSQARDLGIGMLSWTNVMGTPSGGIFSGRVTIVREAHANTRLYPAGFQELNMQIRGTRYFVPKGAPLLLTENMSLPTRTQFSALVNAGQSLPLREEVTTSMTFSAGKCVFSPNPHKIQLNFYVPTGFFTGQMTVNVSRPGSETLSVPRILHFRGMLVPGLGRAAGFTLFQERLDPLAEPPVTSGNARMLSDIVTLVPEG